jgi:hypothetical protein
MKLPIAALAALDTLLPAAARDNGDRTQSRAATRQRFQSLMQPDNTSMSCCGEADAFEGMRSRSRVTITVPFITDGKGWSRPAPVPNCKMKWDACNPIGQGILFLPAQPAWRHPARKSENSPSRSGKVRSRRA